MLKSLDVVSVSPLSTCSIDVLASLIRFLDPFAFTHLYFTGDKQFWDRFRRTVTRFDLFWPGPFALKWPAVITQFCSLRELKLCTSKSAFLTPDENDLLFDLLPHNLPKSITSLTLQCNNPCKLLFTPIISIDSMENGIVYKNQMPFKYQKWFNAVGRESVNMSELNRNRRELLHFQIECLKQLIASRAEMSLDLTSSFASSLKEEEEEEKDQVDDQKDNDFDFEDFIRQFAVAFQSYDFAAVLPQLKVLKLNLLRSILAEQIFALLPATLESLSIVSPASKFDIVPFVHLLPPNLSNLSLKGQSFLRSSLQPMNLSPKLHQSLLVLLRLPFSRSNCSGSNIPRAYGHLPESITRLKMWSNHPSFNEARLTKPIIWPFANIPRNLTSLSIPIYEECKEEFQNLLSASSRTLTELQTGEEYICLQQDLILPPHLVSLKLAEPSTGSFVLREQMKFYATLDTNLPNPQINSNHKHLKFLIDCLCKTSRCVTDLTLRSPQVRVLEDQLQFLPIQWFIPQRSSHYYHALDTTTTERGIAESFRPYLAPRTVASALKAPSGLSSSLTKLKLWYMAFDFAQLNTETFEESLYKDSMISTISLSCVDGSTTSTPFFDSNLLVLPTSLTHLSIDYLDDYAASTISFLHNLNTLLVNGSKIGLITPTKSFMFSNNGLSLLPRGLRCLTLPDTIFEALESLEGIPPRLDTLCICMERYLSRVPAGATQKKYPRSVYRSSAHKTQAVSSSSSSSSSSAAPSSLSLFQEKNFVFKIADSFSHSSAPILLPQTLTSLSILSGDNNWLTKEWLENLKHLTNLESFDTTALFCVDNFGLLPRNLQRLLLHRVTLNADNINNARNFDRSHLSNSFKMLPPRLVRLILYHQNSNSNADNNFRPVASEDHKAIIDLHQCLHNLPEFLSSLYLCGFVHVDSCEDASRTHQMTEFQFNSHLIQLLKQRHLYNLKSLFFERSVSPNVLPLLGYYSIDSPMPWAVWDQISNLSTDDITHCALTVGTERWSDLLQQCWNSHKRYESDLMEPEEYQAFLEDCVSILSKKKG